MKGGKHFSSIILLYWLNMPVFFKSLTAMTLSLLCSLFPDGAIIFLHLMKRQLPCMETEFPDILKCLKNHQGRWQRV